MDRFTVGAVLGRSFSVWGKNLLLLVGLMFIAYVPSLLFSGFQLAVAPPVIVEDSEEEEPRDPDEIWSLLVEMLKQVDWTPIIIQTVLDFLLSYLAQAAVAFAVFQTLMGRPARLVDSLRGALRRLPTVLGAACLVTLMLTGPFLVTGVIIFARGGEWLLFHLITGYLVLLIPVLWLSLVLWVAIPAAVVESVGVLGALRRSAFLTKGHRIRILGLMILVGLIGSGAGMATGTVAAVSAVMGSLVEYGLMLLVGALSATVVTVGYAELVRVKEGTGVDQLVQVFE